MWKHQTNVHQRLNSPRSKNLQVFHITCDSQDDISEFEADNCLILNLMYPVSDIKRKKQFKNNDNDDDNKSNN